MLIKLVRSNEGILVGVLLIICCIFSIGSPYFLDVNNIFLISGQMAELGLMTLGMAASFICGGFDLSVGAVGSMCSILLAIFIGNVGLPIWLSMLIVFVVALLIGAINGFLCGYLEVEPFMVTLGTSGVIAGLSLGISKGQVLIIHNQEYVFGKLKFGGIIPSQLLILLATTVAAVILLNYTRWGRRIYMLGCNRNAAKYSGINVQKTTFKVYLFSAFCAFLAAVVISSRLESGKANLLEPLNLQAVTAAIFGGISLNGGTGNVIGAIIGVITFSVISNGLNLIGLSQFLKQVITGMILLAVLTFNIWREKKDIVH
jgi:ribose/xylose/arabinose/galactoside ABC-type transport system permease subunit